MVVWGLRRCAYTQKALAPRNDKAPLLGYIAYYAVYYIFATLCSGCYHDVGSCQRPRNGPDNARASSGIRIPQLAEVPPCARTGRMVVRTGRLWVGARPVGGGEQPGRGALQADEGAQDAWWRRLAIVDVGLYGDQSVDVFRRDRTQWPVPAG